MPVLCLGERVVCSHIRRTGVCAIAHLNGAAEQGKLWILHPVMFVFVHFVYLKQSSVLGTTGYCQLGPHSLLTAVCWAPGPAENG